MGGTGRAPNRRKSPFSGFLARKSRFKASKSFPVPCEIDLYLAQLANSISETSSQLTLPSSGESAANLTSSIRRQSRSVVSLAGDRGFESSSLRRGAGSDRDFPALRA